MRPSLAHPVGGIFLASLLTLAAAPLMASGTSASALSLATVSATHGKGIPVDVLYAGSLTELMENQIGPAFSKATGYRFTGFAGGSKELASQIRGRLRPADVFISASPAVDASLEGKAGGNWVTRYTVFATSYLVIGYNPHSRFVSALRTRPWYQVVGEPGFRLGRTDPAIDPKGVLAEDALTSAATRYDEPALAREAKDTSVVFPEESLVGRLQEGELDAGFFYEVEAVSGHIPTVPLSGYTLHATYTVAVVNHAPHPAGAASFVAYLFRLAGSNLLRRGGLSLSK